MVDSAMHIVFYGEFILVCHVVRHYMEEQNDDIIFPMKGGIIGFAINHILPIGKQH
jgi:hypothetical protein